MTSPATVLQPGAGPIRAGRYLPAARGNVIWGRLPCAADAPVLEIDPGDEVTIDTISHEGVHEDHGRDPVAYFGSHGVPADAVLADAVELAAHGPFRDPETDGGHVITGPIAVRGARPGDLLAMTVVEHALRVPYGVVSNRHGRGALPGEYPVDERWFSVFASVDAAGAYGELAPAPGAERSIRFPLAPFLGIMGVAAAGDVRPHSVPPGAYGGNLDINLLGPGATLYLPVQAEGALAYVGDPHFAQGDGEVALTALEGSLRSTIRFDVVPHDEAVARFGELRGPVAETPEHLVPIGLDEDLDTAVQHCVRAAIALLCARYGIEPRHAYAYLSAATDFDISQVVDLVKGVHARIRIADFAGLAP